MRPSGRLLHILEEFSAGVHEKGEKHFRETFSVEDLLSRRLAFAVRDAKKEERGDLENFKRAWVGRSGASQS